MSLNGDESFSWINLKLQKLIYYIQAWSLGINKEPMMNARFEAWVHGPVCRQLYERFKSTKSLYSVISKEDIENSETPIFIRIPVDDTTIKPYAIEVFWV